MGLKDGVGSSECGGGWVQVLRIFWGALMAPVITEAADILKEHAGQK